MVALFSRQSRLPGTTSIEDKEFGTIRVVRAKTHYIRIKVEPDGKVSATIPTYATLISLKALIDKNRSSLRKSIAKLPEFHRYTDDQIKQIRKKAKEYFPVRVEYFAKKYGYKYNKLSFRNQKTRWGSCSSDNNISLNIALITMPPDLIDYVILHELTHTIEKNHSAAFWSKLEQVCPNYKELRKELHSHTPYLS